MKIIFLFILSSFLAAGCNNTNNHSASDNANTGTTKASFFPVTSYIKGQIADIRNRSLSPLMYTTSNNQTDSIWLKPEDLENVCHEFLYPTIDTQNLINYFTEAKFKDETINAFTYTYDATGNLPDTFTLRHWDVYIDPDKNSVRKIYLVKNYPDKILQLTWYHNAYCQIVTIKKNNSTETIEKEEKIKWQF